MKIRDWVLVKSTRPLKEQYNGAVGEITTITNADIVYVCIGRVTPCFYMDEVTVITAPVQGGAA